MSDYVVRLGRKANSFYDPVSGIKVLKGQQKPLRKVQYHLKGIQKALRYGHLEIVPTPEIITKDGAPLEDVGLSKEDVKTLVNNITEQYLSGKEASGIAKLNSSENLLAVLNYFKEEQGAEISFDGKVKKIELAEAICAIIEGEQEVDQDLSEDGGKSKSKK